MYLVQQCTYIQLCANTIALEGLSGIFSKSNFKACENVETPCSLHRRAHSTTWPTYVPGQLGVPQYNTRQRKTSNHCPTLSTSPRSTSRQRKLNNQRRPISVHVSSTMSKQSKGKQTDNAQWHLSSFFLTPQKCALKDSPPRRTHHPEGLTTLKDSPREHWWGWDRPAGDAEVPSSGWLSDQPPQSSRLEKQTRTNHWLDCEPLVSLCKKRGHKTCLQTAYSREPIVNRPRRKSSCCSLPKTYLSCTQWCTFILHVEDRLRNPLQCNTHTQ